MKQLIIIDGNHFDNIKSFYKEIDRVLTKGLKWETGHNLNAFNDLLRGGFGVYEYEEDVEIKWINFSRSRNKLGQEMANILVEILSKHSHIDFKKEE
jgi:RNAse (barnase) inhibitor barstar